MIFSVAQSTNWLSVCGYPPGPRYFLDVCLSLGYRARYSAVYMGDGAPSCVHMEARVFQTASIFQFSKHICMYTHVCIYIYMLTPPKPTVFDFLLCFTVIFVGFCLQKQPACFSFIWRLWMLEHDESWCFMCRYNDIFWWYLQRFRLQYWVPSKEFQFKHWQNAHGTVAKCQF